jgi:hypothetical protein
MSVIASGLIKSKEFVGHTTEAVAATLFKVGDDQPSSTADAIKRGQAALKRLEHATWPDWCAVAMALAAGRTIAMQEASTNKPQGPRYRKAIGNWLRIWGFDRIDKSDRTRLLEISGNLMTINAWRDGLPPEQRFRFNSPTTVLRAWRRANDPTGGGNRRARSAQAPLVTVEAAFRRLSASDKSAFFEKILPRPDQLPPKLLAQLEARFAHQHQHTGKEKPGEKIATLARKITAFSHHPEQHVDEIRKIAAEILRLADPNFKTKGRKITATEPALDTGAWARGMRLPVADSDDAATV